MTRRYIAIEGNIGSGKTSLARMLADLWDTTLMLEEFADNPFLPGFYQNPEKYAFPLELSFLGERFEQLKRTFVQPNLFQPLVISDYYILKSLLFAKINLGDNEYELFSKLYFLLADKFPKPDLVVYLNNSIPQLQKNIKLRGRPYELEIKDEYLQKVQKAYLEAFRTEDQIPIMLINTGKIDFVASKNDFKLLADEIKKSYNSGLHIIDFQ